MSRYFMPFGRYRDLDFDEIPDIYLLWLRTQDWVYPELKQDILDYFRGQAEN